ncbi:helix-turn-helix domain-containing protein [Corynebacterium hylobatis]|uniref:Helix-turn-helix domain-containing protein n=1 Tax=Corynebacterium hylobatis TaxID=1859290 RepID=A0A430HZ33_9CORY|nr:helix-turn-helix domain-containing protein [Corynebacterium hylobatis]RSZ63851.1 helix-turn-helix domain-containing protein [Corynebacterium hylobatis]
MSSVLDTRSVPPHDRQNYWSCGIAEHFFPIHIEAEGVAPLDLRLASGQIGPVGIRFIQGLPHRVTRTPGMITAADPQCILLYLLIRGVVHLEQDDRSCVLQPGDLACQDTSSPSVFESRENFEVLVFSVPKWFIGGHANKITQHTATRVGRDEGRLSLLAAPFLINLARTVSSSSRLPLRDGNSAAEMLLSMLNCLFDEEEIVSGHSHPEDLFTRMQLYAMEHLDDPHLGPEKIAQAHFVSTRYVHKLFASSGSGVSAWIRQRRLEGASEELRCSPATPVSTIAVKWGYRNPGSFSRAFRERFGYAPREARQISEITGDSYQ